ncbi:F-box protein CPR1 [Linum perenne]
MSESPPPTAVIRLNRVPDDIVSDIFLQLPAKTLLRFRSLSKPLCELIDSSDFIRQHLAHSLLTKSNHSLILHDWHLHTVDLDSLDAAEDLTHPLYAGGGTEAVGSVNGLVALRNSERDLAIYNIATRQADLRSGVDEASLLPSHSRALLLPLLHFRIFPFQLWVLSCFWNCSARALGFLKFSLLERCEAGSVFSPVRVPELELIRIRRTYLSAYWSREPGEEEDERERSTRTPSIRLRDSVLVG